MTKPALDALTGIGIPPDFVSVAAAFTEYFGGGAAGLEALRDYVGFAKVVRADAVRGYEGLPFEAELPLATGSNGEHMGWLNLAPEVATSVPP